MHAKVGIKTACTWGPANVLRFICRQGGSTAAAAAAAAAALAQVLKGRGRHKAARALLLTISFMMCPTTPQRRQPMRHQTSGQLHILVCNSALHTACNFQRQPTQQELTNGLARATMWSASASVMKLWKTKARGRHDTGSTLALHGLGRAGLDVWARSGLACGIKPAAGQGSGGSKQAPRAEQAPKRAGTHQGALLSPLADREAARFGAACSNRCATTSALKGAGSCLADIETWMPQARGMQRKRCGGGVPSVARAPPASSSAASRPGSSRHRCAMIAGQAGEPGKRQSPGAGQGTGAAPPAPCDRPDGLQMSTCCHKPAGIRENRSPRAHACMGCGLPTFTLPAGGSANPSSSPVI